MSPTRLIASLLLAMVPVVSADPAGPEHRKSIEVAIQTPGSGWNLRIDGIYEKAGQLLVVCRVMRGNVAPEMKIGVAKARLGVASGREQWPRRILLVDRPWDWGDGYTAVDSAGLARVLKGSREIYKAPVDQSKLVAPEFIGLTKEDAMALAKKRKIRARVVRINGVAQPIILDHDRQRLNFSIERGRVVKVSRG